MKVRSHSSFDRTGSDLTVRSRTSKIVCIDSSFSVLEGVHSGSRTVKFTYCRGNPSFNHNHDCNKYYKRFYIESVVKY